MDCLYTELTWRRHPRGVRLTEPGEVVMPLQDRLRFLTTRIPDDAGETYTLDEDGGPAVFSAFAKLSGEEEILGFAARYGLLTNNTVAFRETPETEYLRVPELPGHWRMVFLRAESLAFWEDQIRRIGAAMAAPLDDLIPLVEDALAEAEYDCDIVRAHRFDDPRPAMAFVCRDLGSALWVRMLAARAEGYIPRRCAFPGCPNHILIVEGQGGKRRDAKYCSDACKSKAYRRRKAGME